jgi:hypothetical protein
MSRFYPSLDPTPPAPVPDQPRRLDCQILLLHRSAFLENQRRRLRDLLERDLVDIPFRRFATNANMKFQFFCGGPEKALILDQDND